MSKLRERERERLSLRVSDMRLRLRDRGLRPWIWSPNFGDSVKTKERLRLLINLIR